MELRKLFEPIRIGNLELKNRITMSPMATGFPISAEVNQRLVDFYRERAKGGVGLIVISAAVNRGDNNSLFPGIYDDRFIPGLAKLARVCHEYDTKVCAQLILPYSWAFLGRPVELVSPSGQTITKRVDPLFRLGGPPLGTSTMRRPLEEGEVVEIIEAFGDASRRAREAGFDGVQFMEATGYLASQFLSPLTNKRTDRYGGSLENRMRCFIESLEDSKRKAGEDWTYLARMSAQWTENGITFDELKEMAVMAEKAGVHAIDAMPGWHEEPVPMIAPSTPQGQWAYISEDLKKAVSIPIGAGSQIQDPEVGNRILEEGKADYIYMCRALIADPALPNKAKKGRLGDIVPCLTCSRCLEAVLQDRSTYCYVNPRAGKEGTYSIEVAEERKKVFVVGGGPAGMEAAIVAANRGHDVTLFERSDQLGGKLRLAELAAHKEKVGKLKECLIRQVGQGNIKVELKTEFTPALMAKGKPEVVILAAGGVPVIPGIPGADGKNVISAIDALSESKELGEKVVIVGGGMIGCETAEVLVGKGKQVTIIEMLGGIAIDESLFNRYHLIGRLKKAGVRIETNMRVAGITERGVEGVRDSKAEFFESDSVVLATGLRGETELLDLIRGKGAKISVVGDCAEPRQICQAMDEGFLAGARA